MAAADRPSLLGLLRRHRDYRLLLSAGLISLTGDWLLNIGLAYYVYALTGSTLASGLTVLSELVPALLLGSVAGVFVDRWDRRRTLWVVDLLLAASLLPLLAVRSAADVWLVYVAAFVVSCLEQLFAPAEAAIVPELVPAEDLLAANAVNGQARNLSRLLGGAAGGVAAATGGLPLLVAVDAATYLLSALLIWRMAAHPVAPVAAAPDAARALRRTVREWADGARLAHRSPALRPLLAFVGVVHVGEGIMATLFAPFVRSVLHGSGSVFGAIVAAQGVGGVAAAVVVPRMVHGRSTRVVLATGAVVFGCLDLVLFLYPLVHVSVLPALLVMLVVGVPGALVSAGMTTVLQTNAPDSHRGRVLGAAAAVGGAGMLVGIGVASTAAGPIGIVPVIALQGVGYVLGGLWLSVRLPQEPPPVEAAVAPSPA